MLHSPLFSSLQHLWKNEPEIAALCDEIDSLLAGRSQGLKTCPSSESIRHLTDTLMVFRHIYDSASQPDPNEPLQFYRAYAAAILNLQPLVDVSRWPRWLMLEQMLSSASAAGDLLSAALALRTQIEMLDDFIQLQAYESQLPDRNRLETPFAVTHADCQRIRDHATLLWCRFLPILEVPNREEMIRKPALPKRIAPRPDELNNAFDALNDYVHPNYGSHVQAIWPEHAASGLVLLKALISIYRTFLSFPWARSEEVCPGASDQPKPETSWIHMVKFAEETLPSLCQVLRDEHGYPHEWRIESDFLDVFQDRIEQARNQWENSFETTPDSEPILEILRPICSCYNTKDKSVSIEEVLFFPQRTSGLGLPATVADWISLSAIRRHALTLDNRARSLSKEADFPSVPPYDDWVCFLKTALEFSIMVGVYKMHLMQLASKRSVNEKNPLAAILCARAAMEHYAVSVWLTEKFDQTWNKIEDAARSGQDVLAALSELETDVGRFLSGTKGTAESTTSWRNRWIAAGRARHVNLKTIIEKAFPAENAMASTGCTLRFLYDWFCRVVHGDKMTGSDLLEPGGKRIAEKQIAKVVILLARFESVEAPFRLYGLVASIVGRMSRPNGIQDAETPEALRSAIKKGTIRDLQFKRDRDVFGSGTESDPYYFRQDLFYHEAFNAFLDHEEIRAISRVFWFYNQSQGDRVESRDGRVLFFWNRHLH